MSNSHSHSNSHSNSFELQAKADEWMEVTPKEELLRAELDRLQEAFRKCSAQLERSQLENNLLRDRAASLGASLDGANAERQTVATELERVERETGAKLSALESDLSRRTTELEREHSDRATERKRHEIEMGTAAKASAALALELRTVEAGARAARQTHERELRGAGATARTHKTAALRFAEDLRRVLEQHASTKTELETCRKNLRGEQALRQQAETTTGTIAVLAETLRADKARLVAELSRLRTKLEESKARFESDRASLGEQLATAQTRGATVEGSLRSELNERTDDLTAMGRSHERLQVELKDAEAGLRESSVEIASLKAHLLALEKGRHELLEKQCDLEDTLGETHEALQRAREDVHATRNQLEEAVAASARAAARNDSRTKALEQELVDQRDSHEETLAGIHSILGLSFAKAVRTEVRTLQRSALEQLMPSAARVPLLPPSKSTATATTATATATAAVHLGRRSEGVQTV
mmetsp:Transcript_2181/g.5782  ORF Transcript_2181/g.5782 Transcript_2181/m.5782 type:complete len:475 (-) Transcript_2181:264-1688(-)